MDRVLDFFDMEVPIVAIKSYINGQDADSPPGPTLAAGTTASFTYQVSNTGSAVLENVVVMDDNGTPGNLADDFSPAYTSGDGNGNSLLDVGETWLFTATPTLAAGQRNHLSTVTAEDSLSQVVEDADPISYFGSAPGIHIKTYVEGDDADSPPGPMLDVGTTATFVYFLTNTGNVPLSNVIVVDDNGTPGNPADDFNATYGSGDTSLDGMLGLAENWVFFAQRPVTAGQHTSLGTALGEDSISQIAGDSDPTNYFGAAPDNNADFNANGVVDAADYAIWRKHNGTSVPAGTLGDADGNGEVNDLDYDSWVAQFGTSPGSGGGPAAASEPASEPQIAEAPLSQSIGIEAAVEASSIGRASSVEDEVFGSLATRPRELDVSRRRLDKLPARVARETAHSDWQGLLLMLAERKATREVLAEGERWMDSSDERESFLDEFEPDHRRLGPRLLGKLSTVRIR
jgi:hypothetical protein